VRRDHSALRAEGASGSRRRDAKKGGNVTNRPHAPFKWAVKDNDKSSPSTRRVRESWDELQEDNALIGRLVSTDPSTWPAEYAGRPKQMARRRVRFT